MTLNKSTFVLTSWPQTSSWSWTWPFQQEDGKKREGRGGILHPNPLSPSRPDLTWPFTPDCIALSPTPDLDPDWRGLVLRQTGTCFSGRTWTFPPNATDSCSMYYNGDSPWGRSLSVVAFFFFLHLRTWDSILGPDFEGGGKAVGRLRLHGQSQDLSSNQSF